MPIEYRQSERFPKDRLLYERLDVSFRASTEEIWFAFFRKVYEIIQRRSDDARSKDLAEVAEAYQVLSDPGSREAYFKYGTSALPDCMLDSAVIRDMVFGSSLFRNYIGDSALDLLASVKDDNDTSEDQMKKVVQKNKELLDGKVPELADFMETKVKLPSNDLEEWARSEAQRLLVECGHGEAMLGTIGPIYKSNANMLIKNLKRQVDNGRYSHCQKEATLWEVCEAVLNKYTSKEKKMMAENLQKLGEIVTNPRGQEERKKNGIKKMIKKGIDWFNKGGKRES